MIKLIKITCLIYLLLTCLCVSSLVDLSIGPVSNNLNQIKDARGILQRSQINIVQSGLRPSAVGHHGSEN